MEEIWKTIKNHPDYKVSNFGRVKRDNHIRVPDKSRTYYRVNLSTNGEIKTLCIHRLVAEAFIPNPNNYPYVNHLDGNKLNNRADNLEWCTCKQNVRHAIETGLRRGIKEADVKEIRELYKNGWTRKQLCERFGVSMSSLGDCVKGIRKYKYLSDEERREVLNLYDTGEYSFRKLGRMFGVDHCTISNLVKSRAA